MRLRLSVLVTMATMFAGCGSVADPVRVEEAVPGPVGPSTTPYTGPLDLPVDHRDRAGVRERSGSAGRALECAGQPYDGGGADYDSGLAATQRDPQGALANLLAEDWFRVPEDGYRVEREQDGHVLLSWDAQERTVVAFVAADDVHDWRGDIGWGITAWAMCDPAELPEAVAEELGFQVWQDRSGARVPVAEIESYSGPEHCDWQTATFVRIGHGRAARTYLRDPEGVLPRRWLQGRFEIGVRMPDGAVDTGYRRDGRALYVDAGRAAYLLSPDGSDRAERWPAERVPIGCD